MITIIIPARMGSTRLPGKPLLDIKGEPMIWRVYERCLDWGKADQIVVATDNNEISDAVISRGGKSVITKSSHQNGTNRCLEAFEILGSPEGILINVQGDEPILPPDHLDGLLDAFYNDNKCPIVTLGAPILESERIIDSIVKVKLNASNVAVDFRRTTDEDMLGHIGIYGFRTYILKELKTLPISIREQKEKLEQLRWLEAGIKIGVNIVKHKTPAIDTMEDYLKILDNCDI